MSDNPTVNRYLKDKAMDHIDHALGRPIYPLRESYRNYFATDVRSDLGKQFEASPHWEVRNVTPDAMAFYSVTDAGRAALASHLSKLDSPWRAFLVSFDGYSSIVPERSPGKAKYAYYLRVSDAWSELTFSYFCKRATVRSLV